MNRLPLALWVYLGSLLSLTHCAPPAEAATAAAVTAATLATADLNREVDVVRVELRADFRARASLCPVPATAACLAAAHADSRRALGPRVELARRAIAAQNRTIDAIEAGARCPDDPCRATQAAAAAAAGAEVASLLVQLRQTAPAEPPEGTP